MKFATLREEMTWPEQVNERTIMDAINVMATKCKGCVSSRHAIFTKSFSQKLNDIDTIFEEVFWQWCARAGTVTQKNGVQTFTPHPARTPSKVRKMPTADQIRDLMQKLSGPLMMSQFKIIQMALVAYNPNMKQLHVPHTR